VIETEPRSRWAGERALVDAQRLARGLRMNGLAARTWCIVICACERIAAVRRLFTGI